MRALQGWFALFCAIGLGGASPASAAITDYPFRVVTRGAATDYQVVAENNGPSPISVRVDLTGNNYSSDRQWPVTTVVPPNASLALGRIYGGVRPDVIFDYSYHFGRLDAVEDGNALYRLPFEEGRGFEISQAYGGKLTSHGSPALMYAVDFAMPSGSPVMAARAGVVVDVTLRFTEGAADISFVDKANTIAVVHDDGTVAEYAHLSPGPANVAVGQRVAAGELLGYSGSTGYSAEPHLHFIVSRPVVNNGKVMRVSVPVQFYAGDPAMRFSVRMGTTVWANYGAAVTAGRAARANAVGNAVNSSRGL